MLTAITRNVGSNLIDCELTYLERQAFDVHQAILQHRAYAGALRNLGVAIISLPSLPQYPDGVFVEDTAVVLDEVAILGTLGARSRHGEQGDMAAALKDFRSLVYLHAPATLDGGDVLRIGKALYVGLSSRTNEEAVGQLENIIRRYGYSVTAVPTKKSLHLKTACSYLGDNTLLINPAWVNKNIFQDYQLIETSADEAWAANALLVNDTVLYPTAFPSTLERIRDRFSVETLDISELQKAEAGLTCMSIVFSN